MFALQIELHK